MEVRIRQLENDMITIGTGVIAFGFWSFIKSVLTYIFVGESYFEDVTDEYRTICIVILWIIFALIPLVYLWIGLSARAEGNGKHKSVLYLIMLCLIILFSTFVIILELFSLYRLERILSMTVTIIIDLTRMVFLMEILVYSITLRTLRKQQSIGEGSKE